MSFKSLDEREDSDELRDPKVKQSIAVRTRPAEELLAELKQSVVRTDI